MRRRAGECSEVSRGSHDAKGHTSGRSLSTGEASNRFRCVGLNEVVVWRGLPAARAPEHRLVVGVVGMARGGEFNARYGNKLMRLRLLMQGIAVVLFVVLMVVAGTS